MGGSAINVNKRIQEQKQVCVCVCVCVCVVERGYNDFSYGCFGFEVLLRHTGKSVRLRIRIWLMLNILSDNGCIEGA